MCGESQYLGEANGGKPAPHTSNLVHSDTEFGGRYLHCYEQPCVIDRATYDSTVDESGEGGNIPCLRGVLACLRSDLRIQRGGD